MTGRGALGLAEAWPWRRSHLASNAGAQAKFGGSCFVGLIMLKN